MPGKRRGPPRTDIHERVLALYRQGNRPATIARTLRITKPWISRILTAAGIDARADARKLARSADAAFRKTWQSSPDLVTAAKRLGLTRRQAQLKAVCLRVRGVALKRFKPAGSNAGRVWTAAEDALFRTLTDAEMAAKTGRKESAVMRRRQSLRARRKG